MDYQEAIHYLDSHIDAGVKPGLERIRLLVETMGSPHLGYPMIHVAGTNGKTSVTRMAASLLLAHGLTVGTFTSPHLERVEQRFGVNGRDATPDEMAQAAVDVAAFADLLEARGQATFTYFELTTAMAFAFFVEHAVESAVVEVGLGGRLDATNVIDAEVAVLTGVDIEHTEYLGNTVEAIANEKLAIAGPGSILVTGPVTESVLELANERARELGIQHRSYGKDFSAEATPAVGGWQVDVHGAEEDYPELLLPVHGRHQVTNAATAVASVEALLGRRLSIDAVREAFAAFTAPGRMEVVASEPLLMLDGAHNPAGFKALAESMAAEFPTTKWVLVLGAMGDKDLEKMVGPLADRVESVVTTAVPHPRAIPATELADRVIPLLSASVEAVGDPVAALEVARQKAGSDGAVLVTGSLYLVGHIRPSAVGS
ncbi:MAG TPA: folylpolyglutamate synthase/dihydrofolate synthase family protein [Acidimicrobiia bacterium]|jgi:dihydrofolate synthase/folylpolyglutamate synthase|nr:folylpolyglutamate synthase/dihydrofolate synthase family protein [Acidimicrobiia bacterium]